MSGKHRGSSAICGCAGHTAPSGEDAIDHDITHFANLPGRFADVFEKSRRADAPIPQYVGSFHPWTAFG